MPNLNQDVPSLLEPISFVRSAAVWPDDPPVGSNPPDATADQLIWSGYPNTPCKVYRWSTVRNSPSVGGSCRPRPASPVMIWYSQKPKRVAWSKDKVQRAVQRKLYLLAKEDWRKRKPAKTRPKVIREGWEEILLPDGTYDLRKIGRHSMARLDRYVWVPAVAKRLRPKHRKWTRSNKRIPLLAKVNDLVYYRQTAYSNGLGYFSILNNPDGDGDGGGGYEGENVVGWSYLFGNGSTFPWSDHSMTRPTGFDDHALSVDPAVDFLTIYSDEIDEVSAIALNRHYAKLKNQKVDLATELSQGMLTVNLIGDIAKRIGGSLLKLKKLDLVGAFKLLFPTNRKEVANDYLMWQYGIKPLLGDVQGAAEHLAEFISKGAPVKSNGHATKTFVIPQTVTSGGYTKVVNKTVKIRVKFGSTFEVPSQLVQQAAQLGFTNSKNVLWELVPFSFVADWFLPIGNFLSALSSLDGLVLKESYKTVFINEFYESDITLYRTSETTLTGGNPFVSLGGYGGTFGGGYLTLNYLDCHLERETVLCKREVIPLPDVPLPRFKNPVSKVHLANALALIQQLR